VAAPALVVAIVVAIVAAPAHPEPAVGTIRSSRSHENASPGPRKVFPLVSRVRGPANIARCALLAFLTQPHFRHSRMTCFYNAPQSYKHYSMNSDIVDSIDLYMQLSKFTADPDTAPILVAMLKSLGVAAPVALPHQTSLEAVAS